MAKNIEQGISSDGYPLPPLARRAIDVMRPSSIRSILVVASQPGMINLAGGLPDLQTLRADIIGPLLDERLGMKDGRDLLQYRMTQGDPDFREAVVESILPDRGIHVTPDRVVVSTAGSQAILEGLGKILINEGDLVLMEEPRYLGVTQAFLPFMGDAKNIVGVERDKEGIIPEALEEALKRTQYLQNRPKVLYLNETNQNPTGSTISLKRRQEVAELARKYNIWVIVDDPYPSLQYTDKPTPESLYTFAPERTIYVGTASKIIAPGLRIGWAVTPVELLEQLKEGAPQSVQEALLLSQESTVLNPNYIFPAIAAVFIRRHLKTHLIEVNQLYAPRWAAMLGAIDQLLIPLGCERSDPIGGMFAWVRVPEGINTVKLAEKAVKRKVAFVPGRDFYSEGHPDALRTMRLCFANQPPGKIYEGLVVIADLIKEELQKS